MTEDIDIMEENKTAAGGEHSLSIENTKRISATGIEGVQGFSPTQFTLIYAGGKIVVGGSDMKMTTFSKQTGAFAASGSITSVKYLASAAGIKNRLFK